MKKILFNLGLIVILAINVILILGGGVENAEKANKAFELAVFILEITIIPTAIYYFIRSILNKNIIFSCLFGVINICYIVAWILYFAGIEMPKVLLYIFDVYALNLYLIFYIIYWKKLSTNQY